MSENGERLETYLDFVREMIARSKNPVTRQWLEEKLQQALADQASGLRDFEAEARYISLHRSWRQQD